MEREARSENKVWFIETEISESETEKCCKVCGRTISEKVIKTNQMVAEE